MGLLLICLAGLHPGGVAGLEVVRHQFEGGAGLAGEQHGGLGAGGAFELLVELLHGFAGAEFVQ